MALSLRDILDLEVFRRAEPRVVAGEDGLDRVVRWIHISELPRIAKLLKGGELLLTTGMGFGPDDDGHRRYVDELAAAGVAGLAVELGDGMTSLPAAMIGQAERSGLPLIALQREVPYVDVTEVVHTAIVGRQLELFRRAEEVAKRFTDLALGGAELKEILETLSSVAKNPVVFEDVAHQVVEFAALNEPVDELLQRWEAHSREGHDDSDERGVVHHSTHELPCTWIGIWLRGEFWGRVHLLHVDSAPDELTTLILDRAAATIALTLLAQRDASLLVERARSLFVSDLVRGLHGSATEVFRRARSLGVDLEGRRLVVLVVETLPPSERATESWPAEQDRQRIRAAAVAELRNASARADAVALAGLGRDGAVAVVGLSPDADPRTALETIASEAVSRLRALEDVAAVAGISRESRVDALAAAFEQASDAARYARDVGSRSGVQHYDDLGLHQLLLPIASRPELARFVESELGPLLAHDAKGGSPLLPTLRVYLSCSGNKTDATRELYIERRTLYRRLARMEQILGHPIADHDSRTRLTIALYGLDLLRDKPHTG